MFWLGAIDPCAALAVITFAPTINGAEVPTEPTTTLAAVAFRSRKQNPRF